MEPPGCSVRVATHRTAPNSNSSAQRAVNLRCEQIAIGVWNWDLLDCFNNTKSIYPQKNMLNPKNVLEFLT